MHPLVTELNELIEYSNKLRRVRWSRKLKNELLPDTPWWKIDMPDEAQKVAKRTRELEDLIRAELVRLAGEDLVNSFEATIERQNDAYGWY
jgi:hypothetical protein